MFKNTVFEKLFEKDLSIKPNSIMGKINNLEEEIELMQLFLSNKGIEIPTSLIKEMAHLSAKVGAFKVKTTNDLQEDSNVSPEPNYEDIYFKAICVHNKLSKLTYPASPLSIKYTKQSYGLFFAKNKVINWIIGLTILCLILFIAFGFLTSETKSYQILAIVFASGIGAGFYTLSTSRKYLVNRTFDPNYNPTYIIRFLLGITAGSILALILKDIIKINNFDFTGEILAVVGGYSADAVSTILERIADLIVAIFKGTNKNNTEDYDNKVKNTKESEQEKSRLKNMNTLTDLKAKILNLNDPKKIIEEIDKKMSEL